MARKEHLSDDELKRLRPAKDVLPDVVKAHRKGVRGPQKAPTKEAISIRLSPDVLDHFRSTGAGWQGRIDETLKKAIEKKIA